jgi:hypothetical protein
MRNCLLYGNVSPKRRKGTGESRQWSQWAVAALSGDQQAPVAMSSLEVGPERTDIRQAKKFLSKNRNLD